MFLHTLVSIQTAKLVFVFFLAFTLAYSMQELRFLDRITESVLSVFGISSVFVIPMMIGLLPMPGGAIVSAVMLRNIVKEFKIRSEDVTFLNYWFRHVWATIDPIYPSVIIALTILEIDFLTLFRSTYPVAIGMFLSGMIFVRGYVGNVRGTRDFHGLVYIFPVLMVITLTLLGLDIMYSLLISTTTIYVFRKPSLDEITSILKRVVNIRILALLIGLIFYKDLIVFTDSASELLRELEVLNVPLPIIAFVLSFLIGFATGIETGYSAIALPLLLPFTGVGDSVIPKNLMLVFGSGLLGVMFSPLHLCLILTSEYYSSDLGIVYRRFLSLACIVLGVVVCTFYVFNF